MIEQVVIKLLKLGAGCLLESLMKGGFSGSSVGESRGDSNVSFIEF